MALIPSIMAVYIVSMYVPIAKVVPPPPGFTWERFLFPLIQINLSIVRFLIIIIFLLIVGLDLTRCTWC